MSVNYFEQKTEERGSTSVIWGLILVNALIYFIFGKYWDIITLIDVHFFYEFFYR